MAKGYVAPPARKSTSRLGELARDPGSPRRRPESGRDGPALQQGPREPRLASRALRAPAQAFPIFHRRLNLAIVRQGPSKNIAAVEVAKSQPNHDDS
jgi:hypothetical protein